MNWLPGNLSADQAAGWGGRRGGGKAHSPVPVAGVTGHAVVQVAVGQCLLLVQDELLQLHLHLRAGHGTWEGGRGHRALTAAAPSGRPGWRPWPPQSCWRKEGQSLRVQPLPAKATWVRWAGRRCPSTHTRLWKGPPPSGGRRSGRAVGFGAPNAALPDGVWTKPVSQAGLPPPGASPVLPRAWSASRSRSGAERVPIGAWPEPCAPRFSGVVVTQPLKENPQISRHTEEKVQTHLPNARPVGVYPVPTELQPRLAAQPARPDPGGPRCPSRVDEQCASAACECSRHTPPRHREVTPGHKGAGS